MSDESVRAAGIIALSPFGRVLMCRRTDNEGWAFPGGGIKEGEDAAKAAVREFYEETGYRVGTAGRLHMRRVRDGVDFSTFITPVDDEFVPKLNHEHSAWAWFAPEEVLSEGQAVAIAPVAKADEAIPVPPPLVTPDERADADAQADDESEMMDTVARRFDAMFSP